MLNAALLKDLPVRNPHELILLSDPNASVVLGGTLQGPRSVFSYREFMALRERMTTMSGLCASQLPLWRWPVRISGGPQEETHGRVVSENYFSVLVYSLDLAASLRNVTQLELEKIRMW